MRTGTLSLYQYYYYIILVLQIIYISILSLRDCVLWGMSVSSIKYIILNFATKHMCVRKINDKNKCQKVNVIAINYI